MPVYGDSRRYTSYGKQRVHAGTKHSDWMSVVNSSSSGNAAGTSASTSSSFTLGEAILSPTWQAVQGRQLQMIAQKNQLDAAIIDDYDLVNTPDQNIGRADGKEGRESLDSPQRSSDAVRQSDLSLSSQSSSSSSSSVQPVRPRRIIKTATNGIEKARKLLVISTPPSSPPSQTASVPLTSSIHLAFKSIALNRKDSNQRSYEPRSSAKVKPAIRESALIDGSRDAKIACDKGHTFDFCFCDKAPATIARNKEKENIITDRAPARNQKTPAAALPISGRKPSTIDSSLNQPSLHVAPPRGHGAHATASWRRPLTPIIGGHGNAFAGPGNRRRDEKLKRPHKKFEPVSPVGLKQKKIVCVEVQAAPDLLKSAAVTAGDSEKSIGKEGAGTRLKRTVPEQRKKPAELADSEEILDFTPDCIKKTIKGESDFVSQPTQLHTNEDELLPLLEACSFSDDESCRPQVSDFSSTINKFPLFPSSSILWTKLGEATYSEVFVASTKIAKCREEVVVVKIIPLHTSGTPAWADLPDTKSDMQEQFATHEFPQTSLQSDIVREIKITRMLSDSSHSVQRVNGFPEMKGAYIVQGNYPNPLLDAWNSFRAKTPRASENPCPSLFSASQLYALICLSHAGQDLERAKLASWSEASFVLWQVSLALSRAEENIQFEHRDLHWGNILLEPMSDVERMQAMKLEAGPGTVQLPKFIKPVTASLKATIIDFTMSRACSMSDGGHILAGGLEDETIFAGEGDYQYECYRIMKKLVKDNWNSYCPITNVVVSLSPLHCFQFNNRGLTNTGTIRGNVSIQWLHYLTHKLIHDKGLKKPSSRSITITNTPRARSRSRPVANATPSKSRISKKAPTPSADMLYHEQEAHEALIKAESMLSAAVAAAVQAAENTNGAGKPRRSRNKKTSDASDNASVDSELIFANAGDFVKWWSSE